MLKKILLGVVVLGLVAFVVAVFLQPDTFHVERTAKYDVPPVLVFPSMNNLRKWNTWSPWAKLDPNATVTFEGPQEGINAAMHWAGNAEMGEGRMTVIDSVPPTRVRYRLDFIKPFASTSEATFTLKPEGTGTVVTWTMDGKKDNFLMKAMGMIMSCDKRIGAQFEQGLDNLRHTIQSH